MTRFVFGEIVPLAGAATADPQRVGEALEEIAAKSDGELHPAAVVSAARDESHTLHPFFTWDDAVAAEKYREDQARTLIRCIRIEPSDPEIEAPRAFHSVNSSGRAYRSLAQIESSLSLQERLLQQADDELAAFQRRHARIVDICDIVTEARARIAEKRRTAEDRRAAS